MQASKSDEQASEYDIFTCNNCGAVLISPPTMWSQSNQDDEE